MPKAEPCFEEPVRLGSKYEITIPRRVSRALKLKKGDYLLLRVVDCRMEMIPIPKDQRWYWTPEWQRMEREADEDIAQGRIKGSDSVRDLLRELKG